MKKFLTALVALAVALASALPAHAAQGRVTYSGNAGSFVFEPGSDRSLTDLFPDFKDVMPGDTLTQTITVRNDADNRVKAKLYIRSLGAREDDAGFLSRLGLKVARSADDPMGYMFDAAADETAQLTDWVCLGMLYSGGEVSLDVTLTVPAELPNEFRDQAGALDWEFMVEEFPVEPDDPTAPSTGDTAAGRWVAVMAGSAAALILLWVRRKRRERKDGR